jgi:GT2 family glycosyltransferase
MDPSVTVAIPTLDGGAGFAHTLEALATQRLEHELLVCDSGSSDGTVALARARGARVIEIEPTAFSHGATRNLLMSEAQGSHVAFLTQDAVPADDGWLQRLTDAFALDADIGLAFGPYRPQPDASPIVARELRDWFARLSPSGAPRIDRLQASEAALPARDMFGPRSYFTDANGCVARAAWERVPFRSVAYAEDHALAIDMLRAGYAKAYVPAAAVIHSHDYPLTGWLRRSFDEARAIHEVYGYRAPADPTTMLRNLRGNVGADWRAARPHGRWAQISTLPGSTLHHGARIAGGALGARSESLPGGLSRRLSLERRGH